jgi:hypothetical protein
MLHGVQVSWIAISSASRASRVGGARPTKVGIGGSVNLLRPTRAFLVPAVIENLGASALYARSRLGRTGTRKGCAADRWGRPGGLL